MNGADAHNDTQEANEVTARFANPRTSEMQYVAAEMQKAQAAPRP